MDSTVALTVVVIVYNDSGRLPRAVRSVQRQTLTDLEIIVVDDASTDATAQVGAGLAAADPRVRFHRLEANSGGCSRPRNTGIDLARGRYVMFLDSDDELPPNACRTLVEAAEKEQADFAGGRTARRHVSRGGALSPWYNWLYTERVVYQSLADNPDLLYDSLSTNKCYRREFLDEHQIRFPENLHYEDMLFSARAYLHARRFVIVPDLVYYWDVVDSSEVPSITNRTSELSNFRDRLTILRMIDAEIAAAGTPELKLHKDVKFLRHDLRLYVNDLRFRAPADRRGFLDLAADYLTTFDPRAYQLAEPVQAIVAWLITRGDEANLITAVDYVQHGAKLSTRLVEQDGRIYWCADHLDDPEGRAVLDVTQLGLHRLPLDQLDLYAVATTVTAGDGRLHLEGTILNQLSRVPADGPVSLELVVAAHVPWRGERTFAARVVDRDASELRWQADLDLRRLALPTAALGREWRLRFRLHVAGITNNGRVSAATREQDGIAVRRARAGAYLATLVTPDGDLGLQGVPASRAGRAAQRFAVRAESSPATRRVRDTARRARAVARQPSHPRVREEVFRRTLARLPLDPGLAVFESAGGAACTGNPRAVYEQLRVSRPDLRMVWAVLPGVQVPDGCRAVRPRSWAYFTALARAAYWVDDRGFPREAVKNPAARYVQTFAGTPVAWVGFDDAALRRGTNRPRYELRRRVDKWDVLVVHGEADAEVVPKAFRSSAAVLRSGYPRNDVLVRAEAAEVAAARAAVGANAGELVIGYLPSCEQRAFEPLPAGEGRRLVTPDDAGDVTTLLLAADVLVTEHAAELFDYLLLRRPVVLVGCDCRIRARRGSRAEAYVDVDHELPAQTVWTQAELDALLADPSTLVEPERTEAAIARFATYDDGGAAARVVAALLQRADSAADAPERAGWPA